MKAFLNLFGQLNEINLRYSRFGFQHNAVRFDAVNCGVFVFFTVNGLEVLSQRG